MTFIWISLWYYSLVMSKPWLRQCLSIIHYSFVKPLGTNHRAGRSGYGGSRSCRGKTTTRCLLWCCSRPTGLSTYPFLPHEYFRRALLYGGAMLQKLFLTLQVILLRCAHTSVFQLPKTLLAEALQGKLHCSSASFQCLRSLYRCLIGFMAAICLKIAIEYTLILNPKLS